MAESKPTTTPLAVELARAVLAQLQRPEPARLRYLALLADLVLVEANGAEFVFERPAAVAEGR